MAAGYPEDGQQLWRLQSSGQRCWRLAEDRSIIEARYKN